MRHPPTLIKILFGLFIVALLFDLTATVYDLSHFSYALEGNPFVGGPWSAVLVKSIVFSLAFIYYSIYSDAKYDVKFNIVLFYIILTVGQFYGGYSHVPIIQAYQKSTSITVINDSDYILHTPKGNVSLKAKIEKTPYYSQVIWWLAIYPMLIAWTTNYITRKTRGNTQ